MSKSLEGRQYRDAQFRIRRMFGLTAALIGVIGVATTSMTLPVQAQAACASRPDVIKALTKEYAEQSVGMGLASDGNVVELFTNKDGASWTIVVTLPNGMACPVLDGKGWEKLAIKVVGRAS